MEQNTSTLDLASKFQKLSASLRKYPNKQPINQQLSQNPFGDSQSQSQSQFYQQIKTIIEKWVGTTVRMASDKAQQKQNPSDSQLMFAGIIITQYRKFILQLDEARIKHRFTDQLQETFERAASSAMQFLHYEYATPGRAIQSPGKKYQVLELKLKNDILLKMPDVDFHENSAILIRTAIKKFVNLLINHSQEKFKDFKSIMGGFFSQFQSCSSFDYSLTKRLDSKGLFQKQQINYPSFEKINKQVLKIMMEWIDNLLIYFKNPNKIVDNNSGFCMRKDQTVKLLDRQRRVLSNMFKEREPDLSRKLKLIEKNLRKTISNIIFISRSPIKSQLGKVYQDVYYLNKEELSLVLICQYISKTINDYVVDLITTIMMEIQQIQEKFFEVTKKDDIGKLSLINFLIPNLYKCRCQGNSNSIQKIVQKLNFEGSNRENSQFSILNISNRQQFQQKDIIVNVLLKDPVIDCFFICQIQLVNTSSKHSNQFNFSDFLLSISSSTYGMIAELGLLYFNLDFKQNYINKEKLAFQNDKDQFQVQNDNVVCKINPISHLLESSQVNISYICNECYKLVHAYLYYFQPKKCVQCGIYICPICYMKLYEDDKKKAQVILQKIPYLQKFLQYESGPYFFNKPKSAQKQIKQIFNSKDSNKKLKKQQKQQQQKLANQKIGEQQKKDEEKITYLGILTFKNNTNSYNFKFLKMIKIAFRSLGSNKGRSNAQDKKIQQNSSTLYLTSFDNESYDFSLTNDICLVLKQKKQLLAKKTTRQQFLESKSNYTMINKIHNIFHHSIFNQYKAWVRENKNQKSIIVDYFIKQEVLYDITSKNTLKNRLEDIKRSNVVSHSLQIKNSVINLASFNELSQSDLSKITNVSIICGTYHDREKISQQLVLLQKLTKMKKLSIQWTVGFSNLGTHQNLQELLLNHCGISNLNFTAFPNIQIIYIHQSSLLFLPILDLPKLAVLQITKSKIDDIDFLTYSNIPNIKRISISHSKINEIPLFPQGKFQELSVLDLKNNSIVKVQNLRRSFLPKLKYLILINNNIIDTFPSISHFPKLQSLRLSENCISKIQQFQHNSLKIFDADLNRLQCIPFFRCPSLTNLRLVSNKITYSQRLQKVISEVNAQLIEIHHNKELDVLPLVKTKIKYFKIQKSKLLFQIQNIWEKINYFIPFYCDECRKSISTRAMYSRTFQKKVVEDYCKDCYDNIIPPEVKQQLEIAIIISGKQINQNI